MQTGKHFLQIPGPTNVPDSVLRSISNPTIDHRGPEFSEMTLEILEGIKKVVKGKESIPIIFPSSGTGAWEAALVNILSDGDKVLMYDRCAVRITHKLAHIYYKNLCVYFIRIFYYFSVQLNSPAIMA